MKLRSLSLTLPLAASLALFTSCGGGDVDAAGSGADSGNESTGSSAANDLFSGAMSALGDVDWSNLSMDDLKSKAGEGMTAIAKQMDGIKDVADVDKLKEMAEPILASLTSMKSKFGGSIPNATEIQSAITSLADRFPAGSDVMKAAQPIIDQIKALIG
ncbi:MAG: hypothetical protein AAF957_18195 [Planctomycetota bacterium]